MASLPDELLNRIFEVGISEGSLNYRDFCILPFVSRRFRRLANVDRLWNLLWLQEWPSDSAELNTTSRNLPSDTCKSMCMQSARVEERKRKVRVEELQSKCKCEFQYKFEKVKAKRMAAYKRQILRCESKISVYQSEVRKLKMMIEKETDQLKKAIQYAKYLDQAVMASEIQHTWQPSHVAMQHQILVEQTRSNIVSQLHENKHQILSCRERIKCLSNSLVATGRRLTESKQDLESATFNPTLK